jgi:predicted cation transporter
MLFGVIFAVAVFCGLLRYAYTEENYVIAGEVFAGFAIALFFGLVWMWEERESLLHKVVVTLVLAVLLADVMGIVTLGYTGLTVGIEYLFPGSLPTRREFDPTQYR